jgi:ABC-type uncharacterized transport system YnjBCD permease subunit
MVFYVITVKRIAVHASSIALLLTIILPNKKHHSQRQIYSLRGINHGDEKNSKI